MTKPHMPGSTGLLCAVAITMAGCEQKPSLAPFGGVVTYQGTPLEFGGITMQPTEGGPMARGVIQSDGTFSVETNGQPGALIGRHRLRVTCYTSQKPGASTERSDGEMSVGEALIPSHYSTFSSSGLEFDVKPDGSEDVSIELTAP